MKNVTFISLSALVLVGTGAAYLYYRSKHKAPVRAKAPATAINTPDNALTNVNWNQMYAAGLPVPAGFVPTPAKSGMQGFRLASNEQLNMRPKNGVAGMGSFMQDVKSVAKVSLLLTEGSILPFDKNISRKLGAAIHTLPGMHNVHLIGPLKPKLSAPSATADPTLGSDGFLGTGNGVFQNPASGLILDCAPSLLQQYAGNPASILSIMLNNAVVSAGTTDPATGLVSTPSSPGSAQTYGWPNTWTPVPGMSPWVYIADQPVGGTTIPAAASAMTLPVISPTDPSLTPATGPGGVATPSKGKGKVTGVTSSFNPLVAVGAAAVAVGGLFVVAK
jgi:hypothetical protein